MQIKIDITKAPRVHMLVTKTFIERIVKEEVWSQTLWPEDEEPMVDDILASLEPIDRNLVMMFARKQLGVEALGWEL